MKRLRIVVSISLISLVYNFQCATVEIMNNLNDKKKIPERERLGFSPGVRTVKVREETSITLDREYYLFDNDGNILHRYMYSDSRDYNTYNKYEGFLLKESIRNTEFEIYEYNKKNQLIKTSAYDPNKYIYFDDNGNILSEYDNKHINVKELTEEKYLKLVTIFEYNNDGRIIKKEYERQVSPLSRIFIYGIRGGYTIKYNYNNKGYLVQEIENQPDSTLYRKRISSFKYDDNGNKIFEERIIKRPSGDEIPDSKTCYYYFYNDKKQLIKKYHYEEGSPFHSITFIEYIYGENSKILQKWEYMIEKLDEPVNNITFTSGDKLYQVDPRQTLALGKQLTIAFTSGATHVSLHNEVLSKIELLFNEKESYKMISRFSKCTDYEYNSLGDISIEKSYTIRFKSSNPPDDIKKVDSSYFNKMKKCNKRTIYNYEYFIE